MITWWARSYVFLLLLVGLAVHLEAHVDPVLVVRGDPPINEDLDNGTKRRRLGFAIPHLLLACCSYIPRDV